MTSKLIPKDSRYPYDEYLISTHKLLGSVPLSDTDRNVVTMDFLKPGEARPIVMISRRLYVHLDRSISFQDTLSLRGESKIIELSAEFDTKGELKKRPDFEGRDEYFESIIKVIDETSKTDGGELWIRVNQGPIARLRSHEGGWQPVEGKRSVSERDGKLLG